MSDFKEVLFDEIPGQQGFLGSITLNRPEAYNALSHEMLLQIDAQLQQWSENKRLLAVVIHSQFEKAFCAGGDIRALYESGREGDTDPLRHFFFDEYRLIQRIHTYPKPWVSLLNGITMGGGVGISIHGHHRVMSESVRFAMPESTIGFFPDVGGSYFLSRCPGHLGLYLGLSGETIRAADSLYCGLTDHHIPGARYADVIAELSMIKLHDVRQDASLTITALLKRYEVPCEEALLQDKREIIDQTFNAETVEDIITRLQQQTTAWCQELADNLQKKSPLSLKVILQQLKKGAQLNLEECLKMEYGLAQHFIADKDFYEGVRAQIIDKDRMPRWQPESLKEVSEEKVNSYFDMKAVEELHFQR